ncbi:MAG: hypothetical protein II532_04970, partial [Bacteroidales bacterium]|nr:hypothetical protein [Bacteroidales bacterium]
TSANSTVLMSAKPLKEWSQPLPHRDDFRFQTVYLYLPPMPAGEYLLLISGNADFRPDKTELYDDNGAPFNPKDFAQFRMAEFTCCDAAFLVFDNMLPSHYGGRLVNRATGEAIARHQVVLYSSSNKANRKKIATTKTDAEGFFFFDTTSNENYYKNGVFSVIYQGIEYTAGVDTRYYATDYSDDVLKVLFDRPIYRPGDTLHFAVMDYHKFDRLRGEAVSEELDVTVYDVNHKELTKLTLTTNERGAADGWVAIPSNVLPGRMQLHVIQKSKKHSFSEYFRVEAYKQPKFYATMEEDHEAHHYHQPIAVKGMARAYSGASMSGAQVTYTVTRRAFVPWWKRYWGYTVSDKTAEMAHGTTVCANDGSFGFEFVPLPDSGALNQFLTYYVDVTVTDLNGETQTTQTSFMMGPENIRLRAQVDDGAKLRQLKTVDYELTNLDGTPLDGRVRVVVDKLKVPADRGLRHYALCDNGIHTLPLDEYRKQFPLMDYTLTDRCPDNWMVERTVLSIESEATRNQKVTRVDMPPLKTGVYRITLTSVDDEGHKVEDQTTLFLTPDQADRLPVPDLLFLDVDKKRVKVGEEITLRIGSAYDVDVALLIEYGDSVAEPMVYHFSPKHQMQTITITTTEAMAGTIGVNAFALLENVSEDESVEIEVTVPERTLDVTLTTFRDRLQPSVDETWTLKVSGDERYKGGRAPLAGPAQVVLSMYDAALDNYYGTLSWSLPYWRGPGSYVSFSYNNDGSYFYSRWGRGYSFKSNTKDYTPTIFDLSGWRLADIDRGYRSRYMSRNRLKGASLQTIQVIEEKEAPAMAEEEEEEAVLSIVAAVAGVGENEDVVIQNELMYDKGFVDVTEAGGGEPKVNVRTNLNTLAFFRPDLVTDAEGNVSFTFCAPELLTQWNIKGAAWTKDMAVGSLIAQCVTQKELMVVPNAPRYLRQGDVVDFVVKVSNLTDEAQQANVSLTLTDAATGKDIVVDKSLRMVSIDAKSSMAVPFRIVVPDHVAVVTYKVVAYNQYHSDGEQANIIVLPNRQLVTESMAMYVNGRQTKQYALPHLLASDSSNTLQHQMMAVELTSNPIWYAIQTLPYVSECENPSNIYRFHAYYVNSLGSYIAHLSPNIQQVFDQWAQDTTGTAFLSNLQKNEDIKQTLLEETPWLRDGNSENERHRQVAAFFDKEKLSAQLNDNQKRLLESQQRNGGWMWIDGAKETSPYVTQYILKGLGHLSALTQEPLSKEWNRPVEKALDYVDQEEYKYYVKYIKNEKWLSGATDIDYLYTRSFYPDRRFAGKTREAYDFYYNNLRKNYTQFKGLYTRAEVALILHRHGDKKQARELLHRIVQSSQTSDAMGMYWRDNVSGYFWNERPIEVQALIIEAFAEIMPEDTVSVALMQQWLLKQKQTTRWNSDIATIHAVNALMTGSGRQQLQQTEPALTITLGGNPVDMGKAEAGTGYQSRRFQADEVKSDMGDITISKSTDGIAWGAVYWQYFEQLDKIPYSEMGVKMERKLYRVDRDDQLTLVTPSTELKVGDRLRVRILIDCDRNLEYLELRDGRASTFEPVSTRSGWRW